MKYGKLLQLRKNPETITSVDLLLFGRIMEQTPKAVKIHKEFKTYTNVEDMTYGQFVIAETFLKARMEGQLIAVLARPKSEDKYSNDDAGAESIHLKNVLEQSSLECMGLMNEFFEMREKILLGKYEGVIYSRPPEKEEDEPDDMIDFEGDSPWQTFNEQWFFYQMARNLAQGDFRAIEEIYDLPMRTILPELSYLSQKNIIEDRINRMEMARNGA